MSKEQVWGSLLAVLNSYKLTAKHYYTNDFARRRSFINEGGHKIQPPQLMLVINGGWHFLFTEVGTFCLP
jgi:hypothetical protein